MQYPSWQNTNATLTFILNDSTKAIICKKQKRRLRYIVQQAINIID